MGDKKREGVSSPPKTPSGLNDVKFDYFAEISSNRSNKISERSRRLIYVFSLICHAVPCRPIAGKAICESSEENRFAGSSFAKGIRILSKVFLVSFIFLLAISPKTSGFSRQR